jgi:MscS family membrane protein
MSVENLKIKKLFAVLFFMLLGIVNLWSQEDDSKPVGDQLSPYDAVFTYIYYLQPDHYNEGKAASIFYKKGKAGKELAVKLKQILDGKGLKLRLSMVPEAIDFKDSISKKHVYTPFAKDFPEIYLERNKETAKWHFSHETEREIPLLHKEVFPFGSDMLLALLPQMGQRQILGLAVWQYTAMLILIAISFLIHFTTSRIFSFIIHFVASTNLGKDHFDNKLVKRIGRILSYLLISYMVFVLVPVLQLPTGLGYYILLGLRLATTCFIVLLALRTVSLLRSYLEYITQNTKNPTDEHLVPIFAKIINVVIITAGIIQILSIFYVNVTALIAGLSIGGLAIALAAQETVKNLIGSMMIYADRPFKIGDLVTVGTVTGVIEDIGFRSTRIRTLDTTLVSVPNGNLMNETIDNLGDRKQRRYNTMINIVYNTPPQLVENFIVGLREIATTYPEIDKENIYIHLNNLGPSSLDIIFMIYFNTHEWPKELIWREEIIMSILDLAKTLGVQFANPSSSIAIENLQDRQAATTSDLKGDLVMTEKKLQEFTEKLKQKYSKTDETEIENSDD